MRQAPTGAPSPDIDPTYVAMAAATMHGQGRLIEPEPPVDIKKLIESNTDDDESDENYGEAMELTTPTEREA